MGDFESALMYYHRGNKLRPELQDFRLGIQKAQEAIENSVGSKFLLYTCTLKFHPKRFSLQLTGNFYINLVCGNTCTTC